MRSSYRVGLGLLGGVAFLAACGGGQGMEVLQRQPPAVALERAAPPLRPASGDGTGSTVALARFGERRLALVADTDAAVLRMLDTKSEQELPVTHLDGAPSQLVVAADGRVFVAIRDRAEVEVLEQAAGGDPSLQVTRRVATAVEPTSLALTPDGATLLVASGWGHALDAFAARTLEHRFRVDVAREPRAVVASEDGRQAFVSHASASLVSVVDLDAPEHAVDTVPLDQADPLRDGQRVQWRQGYALVRTEIGVVAPGVTAQTGDTTVRTETYGGVDATSMPAESFAVNVLHPHAPGGRGEADVPVRRASDSGGQGCILPRAAAYDARGEWLMVACQGQDAVWRVGVHPGERGSRHAEWKVDGEPTGLAFDDESRTLYGWSQHAHTVRAMALDAYHPGFGSTSEDTGTVMALGPRVVAAAEPARGPVQAGCQHQQAERQRGQVQHQRDPHPGIAELGVPFRLDQAQPEQRHQDRCVAVDPNGACG